MNNNLNKIFFSITDGITYTICIGTVLFLICGLLYLIGCFIYYLYNLLDVSNDNIWQMITFTALSIVISMILIAYSFQKLYDKYSSYSNKNNYTGWQVIAIDNRSVLTKNEEITHLAPTSIVIGCTFSVIICIIGNLTICRLYFTNYQMVILLFYSIIITIIISIIYFVISVKKNRY